MERVRRFIAFLLLTLNFKFNPLSMVDPFHLQLCRMGEISREENLGP